MSDGLPSYLSRLYRLDELEGWHLFARHLELTDGFSFVLLLAPDDWGVAYVRSQLPQLVGSADAVCRVRLDPAGPPGQLADGVLSDEARSARLVWLDADPVPAEQFEARNRAWETELARLNRYRNSFQSRLSGTLVVAGPALLQEIVRRSALDIWTVRSGVFRIAPTGYISAMLKRQELESVGPEPFATGHPESTLAEAERLRGKPGRELLYAELLLRAGEQAREQLKWDLAIWCCEEAWDVAKKHGGGQELRLSIATALAEVFQETAQFDRGMHFAELAMRLAEQHFDADHPAVAARLNNLALLLMETGRLAEAEPLVRRALPIDEQASGDGHPAVATGLNNLALLLKETGRLAEAEPLMRRALAIDEHSYGPEHPAVATRLNNLALLLQDTNRLAEAEPLVRRALAIGEHSYGPEHPAVATNLNNLAQLLADTNRVADAELLHRRAFEILKRFQQRNGYPHPHMRIASKNYATLLRGLGRTEAEIQQALEAGDSNDREHPEPPA